MILEKLNKIQTSLKAPKGQYNNFGKYRYRSAEDILETLKPLLAETKTVINLSDEICEISESGRVYVKATATLYDAEDVNSFIQSTGYAREQGSKKGMDESQITGSSSSYARKYALSGLLALDDNKDADAFDNRESAEDEKHERFKAATLMMKTAKENGLSNNDLRKIVDAKGFKTIHEMDVNDVKNVIREIKEKAKKTGV